MASPPLRRLAPAACLAAWLGTMPTAPQAAEPLMPARPAAGASAGMSAPGPDPADARLPVPPLQHRTPLAGYRPATAAAAVPWASANDNVGRIGGWKAYAREAAAPAPASSAGHAHPGAHGDETPSQAGGGAR